MTRSRTLATVLASVFALTIAAGSADAGRAAGLQFHTQAMSWVSSQHGWLLGSAACGTASCTISLRTSDGGQTWKTLGTLAAPLTNEDPAGVTDVRFADDLHGWAFDPAVWATTDGGKSWTKQTTPGGRPLIALAGNAQAVYAVVSACRFGEPLSHCSRPTTLWRTTPTSGSWTHVRLALPVSMQAFLAVHGVVAYLIVQAGELDPDVLEVTVDGARVASGTIRRPPRFRTAMTPAPAPPPRSGCCRGRSPGSAGARRG